LEFKAVSHALGSQALYSFSNRQNYLILSAASLLFGSVGVFLLSNPGSFELGLLTISLGVLCLVAILLGLGYPTRMSFYDDIVLVRFSWGRSEEIPYGNITRVGIDPDEANRAGYYLRVVFHVRGNDRRHMVPKELLYHNPRLPDPQVDGESLASWISKKAALPGYEDTAMGRWSHQRDNLL
jgi:hypothetical protein